MRKICFCLVWLYIFTVPWYQSLVFDNLGGISRIVTIITIPCAALAVLLAGRLRTLGTVHWMMVAYFLFAAATVFWSSDVDATAVTLRTYLQTMCIVWFVWEFAGDTNNLRRLSFAYVLGGWVALISTLIVAMEPTQAQVARATPEGFNQNDIALVLALGIPIACNAARQSPGIVRWTSLAYVAVTPIAIALTGSRGGATVASIALLAAVLWGFRARLVVRGVLVVGVAALVIGGLVFVPESTIERIMTVTNPGDVGDRVPIWNTALSTVGASPLLGVGAGAFPHASGLNDVAHNTFLSVLAEHGIVGFALFVSVLVGLFFRTCQLPAHQRAMPITLLLCWVIGASSLTWEQTRWTWVVFAISSALPYAGAKDFANDPSPDELHAGRGANQR